MPIQTDVILSLTRTKSIGYLRDVRRLTVALSRARLGLYVLGRREVFESCYELKPAFDVLFQRPDTLMLTTGEMWNSSGRTLADEVEGTQMVGVEHLGQYVFEMTRSKVEALGGESVVEGEMDVEDEDGVDAMEVVEEEEDDDDPLHEGVVPE
jgi:intron-binding protein aquarius